MATDPAVAPYIAQVVRLGTVLDKRRTESVKLHGYDEGPCPLPRAIENARLTKAYKMLMPMAEASWGSLAVSSSLDRLEVAGITDVDQAAADAAWGAWQDNQMDAEAKLAHHAALVTGRAFALIWADATGAPVIHLDSSDQMVVEYEEGSRRFRKRALRRWVDEDGIPYATLYTPDGLYKFVGPKNSSGGAGTQWAPREVTGEPWPLPNPLGVVPVVELAVNRRLKSGPWGHARGEYAHCIGLLDRINLLTFLGLVVAFWMGFPLRGVIGERIIKDDDGAIVPPFEVNADSVFQFENPDAKLAEYRAADRKNLSIFDELDQFATLTRNPRHYFPLAGGMSNIAADTIRANEGSLHAKINGDYKPWLGEAWEEVQRLCTAVASFKTGGPILSSRAELQWKNSESRSLAERADAATKLNSIGLPWPVVAELALDATQDQIRRWDAEAAGGVIAELVRQAQANAAAPAPADA